MLQPFWAECKEIISIMGDVFPLVDEKLLQDFAEGACQQTTMLFEHAAVGTCATNSNLASDVNDVTASCCVRDGAK